MGGALSILLDRRLVGLLVAVTRHMPAQHKKAAMAFDSSRVARQGHCYHAAAARDIMDVHMLNTCILRSNMTDRTFLYTLLCNRGLRTYPAGTPAAIAFKSAQCVGVCGIILFGRI